MNPNQLLQPPFEMARGIARTGLSVGLRIGGGLYGILEDARNLGRPPKPDMDDVTLARKVETEIFRGRHALKGSIDVNVVDGVVWLRGEVKRPQQVRDIEAKARAIPEVRGVENLLHLTHTPAPTRADTPARQQRTRSSTRRPAPRLTEKHVTDDHAAQIAPEAEPSPVQHAERHEGRTPAPFGSTGEA